MKSIFSTMPPRSYAARRATKPPNEKENRLPFEATTSCGASGCWKPRRRVSVWSRRAASSSVSECRRAVLRCLCGAAERSGAGQSSVAGTAAAATAGTAAAERAAAAASSSAATRNLNVAIDSVILCRRNIPPAAVFASYMPKRRRPVRRIFTTFAVESYYFKRCF